MKETEELLESVGESIGYAREYLEQRVELAKLELAERLALTTSTLITSLVFFVLALLLAAIASISLGIFLGDRVGSYAMGFVLVSGIYLLLLLGLFIFRKVLITNPLLNQILTILQTENDHEK